MRIFLPKILLAILLASGATVYAQTEQVDVNTFEKIKNAELTWID